MGRIYILDDNHVICPIDDIELCGKWLQSIEKRTVKKTLLGETVISTIFLGIDHNYTLTGAPVLFETMVFGPLDPENGIQERYCTWDEALIGHDTIVKSLEETGKWTSLLG